MSNLASGCTLGANADELEALDVLTGRRGRVMQPGVAPVSMRLPFWRRRSTCRVVRRLFWGLCGFAAANIIPSLAGPSELPRGFGCDFPEVARHEAAPPRWKGAAAQDQAELAQLRAKLTDAEREASQAREELSAVVALSNQCKQEAARDRAALETALAEVAHARGESSRSREALAAVKANAARTRTEVVNEPRSDSTCDCGSSYMDVFHCARRYFGYESPLPEEHISDSKMDKFARAPQLFDHREAHQIQLWEEFVKASYVQPSHRALLRDSGGMYPDLDRTFLFCFLQKIQPARMLEVGGGESTTVALAALKAVARAGGRYCEHTVIEPYRAAEVPAGARVIQSEMQLVPVETFDALQDGDVLFLDSSHVVMSYGDTLTELVTVLPRLNRGVYVHIHDIFLPYDYLPNWGKKNLVYTEQWLVALLLYGSSEWEVIWGSQLMTRRHKDVLLRMPDYPLGVSVYPLTRGLRVPQGAAFWIRKLGEPIRA